MGMSGMADEMARRIAADAEAGIPVPVGNEDAGSAPGTRGASGEPAVPPAGESNADTAARVPESIPYARFKEVNDRLKELEGFQQLREYGYDPDSLGRLAAFEAQYLHDPVGTWAQLASNLDLPQEVMEAIKTHLDASAASGSASVTPGRAEGESSGQASALSDLPEEVRSVIEWVGHQRQAEENARQEETLDATISYWDELDKADKIETPEHIKLAHISALANSGQVFTSREALVEAARKGVLDYRSQVLGSAVRTGHGGAPLTVPGGAPAPTEPVTFGMDIREATKAAAAAIERGELPMIER